MDAMLALERYRAKRAAYRAYGWVGAPTLRQYMRSGWHKLNPWTQRPDGCMRNPE